MITVTVSKKNGEYTGFVSEGHAGYASEDEDDIICAAVSALVINTVNSLDVLTGDELKEEQRDGFVSFQFKKPITAGGSLLMDSLLLGLTQIQDNYSKHYLKVKVREV